MIEEMTWPDLAATMRSVGSSLAFPCQPYRPGRFFFWAHRDTPEFVAESLGSTARLQNMIGKVIICFVRIYATHFSRKSGLGVLV